MDAPAPKHWAAKYSGEIALGCLFAGLGLMFFWPITGGHGPRRATVSVSHLKFIGLAHILYQEAHDGAGPFPSTWMDQLEPFLKDPVAFIAPNKERKQDEFGYAYYRRLGSVKLPAVQNIEEVPMAFDSHDLSWNANGGLDLLPDPPRWENEKNTIAFLDGHAKSITTAPMFKIKLRE